MDAEIKRKWVEALRSGEYKQARSVLRSPYTDSYCCLGVLCRVAEIELSYGDLCDILPSTLHDKFMIMNDNQRKSFAEIADYIEQNL